MTPKEREAFRIGYVSGLRVMLTSINEGGRGDYSVGDSPNKIMIRTMSERTINIILESVGLA